MKRYQSRYWRSHPAHSPKKPLRNLPRRRPVAAPGEAWRLSSGGTRAGLRSPIPTSRARPVLYLQTGVTFALAALRHAGRTSRLAQQLRQLGDIGRNPPGFPVI